MIKNTLPTDEEMPADPGDVSDAADKAQLPRRQEKRRDLKAAVGRAPEKR